jgi:RNA polymerase sigma factor (TIGR02999 family)
LTESTHQVSELLAHWQGGDQKAVDALMPLVYEELRLIAHRHLQHQDHTPSLESRALVNELYLKIPNLRNLRWNGRTHFLCVMSHLMRQVLVDHARGRKTGKRDGVLLSLDEGIGRPASKPAMDIAALDDALLQLERLDRRQSQIVEMRFFGGLSIEETSEALDISPATVKREWITAKAWLLNQLSI